MTRASAPIAAAVAVALIAGPASAAQLGAGGGSGGASAEHATAAQHSPAATSAGAETRQAKMKRRENRYWVWYAPRSWSAAWGRNGIDITPRTGPSLYVGQAWAGGSPFPMTHAEVFQFVRQAARESRIGRIKVLRRSKVTSKGGGRQQIWQWTTAQKKFGARTRGKSTIILFETSGVYGFMLTTIAAPARQWNANRRLLTQIAKLIFYKPQTPDWGM